MQFSQLFQILFCSLFRCRCPAPVPRYLLEWKVVTGTLAVLLEGIKIEYRKKGPDGQYGSWQLESQPPDTATQHSISFQNPGIYQVRIRGQLPFGRKFEISPPTTVEVTQG